MIGDQSARSQRVTLTGIRRYPVKSCRGEVLQSAVVEPWGLAGDRRWMLVDETGLVVTARRYPRLLLVTPALTDDGLLLSAPGLDSLSVLTPAGETLVSVDVWGTPFDASPAPEEASAWFSRVTGRSVRLVFLDDPTRRRTDPLRSQEGDRVSFADAYPMLLATEESLAALNTWVAAGPRAFEGPVEMTRFRPNLVVSGAPAWAEDTWRRVRIGDTTFRAVKACDRCAVTLIDPSSVAKSKEPLLSLARHRQWDHKTWFAVNLIPDLPGGTVRVGDELQVLGQVPGDEPQR